MLVRFEEIKDSNVVLIVDENQKYLGKLYNDTFFSCILDNKEPIDENDFTYWFVDKKLINKYLDNE